MAVYVGGYQLRVVAQDFQPRKRRSLLGQIVLALLGVLLLFLASFTAFDVPVATQRNLSAFGENQVRYAFNIVPEKYMAKVESYVPLLKEPSLHVRKTPFVPLAAAAIFVGYVLGPVLGAIACAGFVALGLCGPLFGLHLFAAGGGLHYGLEPGFGYLLALIPAAAVVGMITRSRRTSLSQLTSILAGLTVVHLTGVFYLLGSCLVSYLLDGNRASLAWQPWVFQHARNMSWYPLPYDFLASLILIGIAFPFRWLANTLTAPDSAPKVVQQNKPAERYHVVEEFV